VVDGRAARAFNRLAISVGLFDDKQLLVQGIRDGGVDCGV
jgi:hypothetical protein